MAAEPPIQSIVRAIHLLQALNRQPVSSLNVLHQQTGIPKPSLVRMLDTLISQGLVRRAPQHGTYFLTSLVTTLSSGYHSEPRLVEAARDVMDALTAEIKWPLALAVLDVDVAVVRYSTIPQSPLSLLHSSINMRLSLVARALGRAVLAFASDDERDMILKILTHSDAPENALAHDPARLIPLLEGIRRQGYALRDPDVRPVSNTLAVPVFEGGNVVAALGMTWFSSTHSADEAVEKYLGRLREAADGITENLATL